MSKKHYVLIALLFALIISATIQPAIAYFTTFVNAKGGYEISVGDTTTIQEKYDDWKKDITISNKEGSEPVFIRAKVLYTGLKEGEHFSVDSLGWTKATPDDGYYYYGASASNLTILEGGHNTSENGNHFIVEITNIPENPQEGVSFSVTVVYESTPVRYTQDANGNNVPYADWDAKIVRVTTGGNS